MKRVLFTGAAGFIGRHAIPVLVDRGFEVHAVDYSASGASPSPGIHWHVCDLLDPNASRKLVESVKPTHLLHLAWYTTHGKFWTAPENLTWVSASIRLLESFASDQGKRAVYAGTCAEYEWGGETLSEKTTPLIPSTLYGTSKHALQLIFSRACEEFRISSAWGRIFFLYGPGEHPARLVPSAILPLLEGKPAEFTHGRQVRDLLHAEDVARAFVELLDSEVRGPVNIASGEARELREVIDIIAGILGRKDLVRLDARPAPLNEPIRIVANIRRLAEEVRFKPKLSLETGITAVIQNFRKTRGN